ncbi:MAG: hypothetical protein HQK94_14220, partial [Nitrospirae bacterium]|nr:hypothetical protein [Nitrospirota bacterium]
MSIVFKSDRFFKFSLVLVIMITVLVPTLSHAEYTWTEQTGAGSRYWLSISSSSDGSKLVAGTYGGSSTHGSIYDDYIYTSTDSGVTWTTETDVSGVWNGITSNSDGTKLAAVSSGAYYLISYGDYIYTSTDSGSTWTKQTNSGMSSWNCIASSSDGSKLVVGNTGVGYSDGYIYTSTDSGATWIERTGAGSGYWKSIASSSDGSKLAAGGYDTYIYTSTDSGATWTAQTSAGSRYWHGIASSSDGSKLAAVNNGVGYSGGYIYTSTDSGATWTERTGSGSRDWYGIASSSDGSKLAAASHNGYIYTSTDSGATWTAETGAGSGYWTGIASSSDGTKLAAVANNGYIYTASFSITHTLTAPTNTSVYRGGYLGPFSSTITNNTSSSVYYMYAYVYTSDGSWIVQTNSGVPILNGQTYSPMNLNVYVPYGATTGTY